MIKPTHRRPLFAAVLSVLFDLDGTLVDSLPGIEYSLRFALAASGFSNYRSELRPLLGPPIRQILEAVVPGASEEVLDQLELQFRRSYDSVGWQKTQCFEGGLKLLDALRRQQKNIFIVTNKPGEVTQKILHSLGIDQFLTSSLTRDSKSPPYRSKAEMVCHLIDCFRLDAAHCLMVGDTIEDYEAALGAGIPAVVVSHGYGGSAVQSGLSNCYKIKGFGDLASLLLG